MRGLRGRRIKYQQETTLLNNMSKVVARTSICHPCRKAAKTLGTAFLPLGFLLLPTYCDFLKENDIEYWIDKEGIFSSSNYKELIVDAIEVSKAVIFISSVNSNSSINVIREIGYAVNMNKPILPLKLDDAQYAKSIRLDISDIDQIDFKNPAKSSKKLITSLMYVVNK